MSAAARATPAPGGGSGHARPDDGLWGGLNGLAPDSDGALQITGGGAVSVDTETLRATAERFAGARVELDEIRTRLAAIAGTLLDEPRYAWDAAMSASTLDTRLHEAQTGADRIAASLLGAAAAYELVELDAQLRAAHAAGDRLLVESLEARRAAVIAEYPDAAAQALSAQYTFATEWQHEIVRQATRWGVDLGDLFGPTAAVVGGAGLGALTFAGTAITGLGGTGRLAPGARLAGRAGPVTVTPVLPATPGSSIPSVAPGAAGSTAASPTGEGRSSPSAGTTAPGAPGAVAPQSLAAAASRVPGGGDARVRVEKYTMPDGSRQAVVYIAGMQSQGFGGDEPWDNASNVSLYRGEMSDSYAATEAALAAAGVEPGDALHVVGFSQGGMIGAHLALEGDYDVQTLVSLGSPVDADVGSDTLSISVRHTDDPVAALAGGGHGEAVGAPGSFVAERVFDPGSGLGDALLPAHRLTAYAETAALIDASGDPRVAGVQAVFEGLGQARTVDVTEYAAVRG
jgi:pimeloyl-ACP methyl ester carboxylesterase